MRCLSILIIINIVYNLFGFSIPTIELEIPTIDTLKLQPIGKITKDEINESSGLVKSRNHENIFWTHNDSGNKARIFPIHRDGKAFIPDWVDSYTGLYVKNAVNIDWEDIAVDNYGNIIIGAFGNNYSLRKDLALYFIKEPLPGGVIETRAYSTIFFKYPEQNKFPDPDLRFDAEALFTRNDEVYLLTKHRKDPYTCLYKFSEMKPNTINSIELLEKFKINGMVTAADCSGDGKKLAVLTYTNVWFFEINDKNSFFNGTVYYVPIKAKQCEAIAIDGDNLIITNEQRDVFQLKIDKMHQIRE